MDIHTNKRIHRQTHIQRDRYVGKKAHTHTHTHTHTHIHTLIDSNIYSIDRVIAIIIYIHTSWFYVTILSRPRRKTVTSILSIKWAVYTTSKYTFVCARLTAGWNNNNNNNNNIIIIIIDIVSVHWIIYSIT